MSMNKLTQLNSETCPLTIRYIVRLPSPKGFSVFKGQAYEVEYISGKPSVFQIGNGKPFKNNWTDRDFGFGDNKKFDRDLDTPMPYEPRDRFGDEKPKPMTEIRKFKNIVKECIQEIKMENNPRLQLKESLRKIVKHVLNEMATTTNKPEPDKEEKEKISKGYRKDGNERLDKTNEKQQEEIETIVHGIDPTWTAYWDDHDQLIVKAQNLLYARICPRYENNFNVDLMVKLDRVRAIALTWDQVKAFVKANFGDLKNKTNADSLHTKAIDNSEDKTKGKEAGPKNDIVTNRGQEKNGKDAKIKDTKKNDKNYNDPMTKREEDMPDQPMKQVTEPGKDPEGKNKKIDKTSWNKPPKYKNDKKLRIAPPKTKKFTLKQTGDDSKL